jgi:hypothetical protein
MANDLNIPDNFTEDDLTSKGGVISNPMSDIHIDIMIGLIRSVATINTTVTISKLKREPNLGCSLNGLYE